MMTRLSLIIATKGARKQKRTKALDVAFALISQSEQKAFYECCKIYYTAHIFVSQHLCLSKICTNMTGRLFQLISFRRMDVNLFSASGEGGKMCNDVKPPLCAVVTAWMF